MLPLEHSLGSITHSLTNSFGNVTYGLMSSFTNVLSFSVSQLVVMFTVSHEFVSESILSSSDLWLQFGVLVLHNSEYV